MQRLRGMKKKPQRVIKLEPKGVAELGEAELQAVAGGDLWEWYPLGPLGVIYGVMQNVALWRAPYHPTMT